METADLHLQVAVLDLATAQVLEKAAEASLEEAKMRVKLSEMVDRHAAHARKLAKLHSEHFATLDETHALSCRMHYLGQPGKQKQAAALAAAHADVQAAEQRQAHAEMLLQGARQAAKDARDEVFERREEADGMAHKVDELLDQHRACEALQSAQSRPRSEWETVKLRYSNRQKPSTSKRPRWHLDADEQDTTDDAKAFAAKLAVAPCLHTLDLDLVDGQFVPAVPQFVLNAVARAPADIKVVIVSFASTASSVRAAALSLLDRVKDRVEELTVRCGSGAMADDDVAAFWRIIEQSTAKKLSIGYGGQADPLVRKGPFRFRKEVPSRRTQELDASGMPGGADSILLPLLQAYGPALRVLRLPMRLDPEVHKQVLASAAKLCVNVEAAVVCWGPGLQLLSRWPRLQSLRIEGGKVTEEATKALRVLTVQPAVVDRLQRLTLPHITKQQDQVRTYMAVRKLKNLKHLTLSGFSEFHFLKKNKQDLMKEILSGLPLLEELELTAVEDQEELEYLRPECLPSLKVLGVKYNHDGWSFERMTRREAQEWRERVEGIECAFGAHVRVHDRSERMPESPPYRGDCWLGFGGDYSSERDSSDDSNRCTCGVSERRYKRHKYGSGSDEDYGSSSPQCVCGL